MTPVLSAQSAAVSLRHIVATLAYRASKALRDAPPGFAEFRPAPGSRSAGEILAHLGDLADWVLTQVQGTQSWHSGGVLEWEAGAARFFASLEGLDQYLASGAPVRTRPEKLFQGGLADALTHVGQIGMLRRLAGSPVRGENYSVALIQAGRAGADQASPVREFE